MSTGQHGASSERQAFRTRLTELFGIKHPIFAGGLMWLADAPYVAAIVNAGGMGFITSRSFETLKAFEEELSSCKRLTSGRAFGVNLSTSRHSAVPLMTYLDAALAAGVRHFETAGRAPADDLIARIRDSGGIVIHKVPQIRHAMTAERLGVNAVSIVGMECGGHPGSNTDMPAMLLAAIASERLSIPYAIGGGIGTGRQLLAALAMGADGVVIGTRFIGATEVTANEAYKQRMVAATENDSLVAFAGNQSLGGAWRVLNNETARQVRLRETQGKTTFDVYADLIRGGLTRDACYRNGDTEKGMISMGPSVCFIRQVEPIAAIMTALLRDAEAAQARLKAMTIDAP